MGRPCTCVTCLVCKEGRCDCTCRNGPHVATLDIYSIKRRIEDMNAVQRRELKKELFGVGNGTKR